MEQRGACDGDASRSAMLLEPVNELPEAHRRAAIMRGRFPRDLRDCGREGHEQPRALGLRIGHDGPMAEEYGQVERTRLDPLQPLR